MTTLDTLMSDPILGAGILLFVVLCLGVGLFLLSPSRDAELREDDERHMEDAERDYLRTRQLDEYRALANWINATRKGSPNAHRTKS